MAAGGCPTSKEITHSSAPGTLFLWGGFFIRILRTRLALAHRRNNGRRRNVEEEANTAPHDSVRTPGTRRRESGEPEHEVANVLAEKAETQDGDCSVCASAARCYCCASTHLCKANRNEVIQLFLNNWSLCRRSTEGQEHSPMHSEHFHLKSLLAANCQPALQHSPLYDLSCPLPRLL